MVRETLCDAREGTHPRAATVSRKPQSSLRCSGSGCARPPPRSWTSWRSGYRRAGPLAAGPYDLGEVYELVYQFIGKGGKLPVYARWIEGGGRMVTGNGGSLDHPVGGGDRRVAALWVSWQHERRRGYTPYLLVGNS